MGNQSLEVLIETIFLFEEGFCFALDGFLFEECERFM